MIPLRAIALLAVAASCACSSAVQELGRNGDDDAGAQGGIEHETGGGLIGTQEPVVPRNLACPLSRPIEGASCGVENEAPCTFVGAPPGAPDRESIKLPDTTTFCVCTAEHRWACLEGVTMRSLATPLPNDDRCEDGLTVERRCAPGECTGMITCRCVAGRARCAQ